MDGGSFDRFQHTQKLLESRASMSSEDDTDVRLEFHEHRKRQMFRHRCTIIVILVLFGATNLGWWSIYRQADLPGCRQNHSPGPPELTYFLEKNDPEHVLTSFEHDWKDLQLVEDLDPEGHHTYRYADVHWADDRWVPHRGASVAVSKQVVEEYNLSSGAVSLKENATEHHYLVAGYHQLHCLSQIRDAIYYLNGTIEWMKDEPFQWDHIIHCIEAVRQGIHCGLDPTLIPLDSYWPGIPNGQLHVCRNSDALFRWTSEHGHPYPAYDKQAPPARTKEWYERTKHLNLPPWKPDPQGPPVDDSILP